jgi:chemotaxis protein CheD
MIERLDSFNTRRCDIEVKMFGGADMFSSDNSSREHKSVGRQNIETALKIINTEGLNLSASDVGGMGGRKIYFYTHTGEVLLKHLKSGIDIRTAIQHGRENISKEVVLHDLC